MSRLRQYYFPNWATKEKAPILYGLALEFPDWVVLDQ